MPTVLIVMCSWIVFGVQMNIGDQVGVPLVQNIAANYESLSKNIS